MGDKIPKRKKEERLLWSTSNAGLVTDTGSVGGRLTLTTEKLTFEPNSVNQLFRPSMRGMIWELSLDQIKEVLPKSILGLPMGICVVSKSGETYTFSLWGRDNWINLINQSIRQA